MNNKTTMVMGIVVAALVVAVGVVLFTGPKTQTGTTGQTGQTGQAGQTGQTGQVGPPTKVPAGVQPANYVRDYYNAILKGDYEKAYKMQPATNKAQGDALSFAATQKGYGMKGFTMGKASEENGRVLVECNQDLGQNGKWVTVWVFTKSGKDLIAESKQTGMAP